MFYFLPVMLIYAYWELGTHALGAFFNYEQYTFGYFICLHDQEPAELLLALGLLIFTAHNSKADLTLREQDSTTKTGHQRRPARKRGIKHSGK
jgi:hypothetical protein